MTVTLEIEAHLPDGALDTVVRTVTENSRTLKFISQGFEREQGATVADRHQVAAVRLFRSPGDHGWCAE